VTEEGIRGWGRSQITHWRESLALYETFNALWAPEAERLTHKYQQKQREGWSLAFFRLYFSKAKEGCRDAQTNSTRTTVEGPIMVERTILFFICRPNVS
jgi:hypothetical protein